MPEHTAREGLLFIVTQNTAIRTIRSLILHLVVLAASYCTFAYCHLFDGPQAVGVISALVALCSASMIVATALSMIGFERMLERLRH